MFPVENYKLMQKNFPQKDLYLPNPEMLGAGFIKLIIFHLTDE